MLFVVFVRDMRIWTNAQKRRLSRNDDEGEETEENHKTHVIEAQGTS